jgi:hypothetical protein
MLNKAIDSLLPRDFDHRLIFLKSWNEWAEGNFVEPSAADGHQFLTAIKNAVGGFAESLSR